VLPAYNVGRADGALMRLFRPVGGHNRTDGEEVIIDTRPTLASAWHASFAMLVLALVLFGLLYGRNEIFDGDFFEHAAVVRALIRDPWYPKHPLLDVAAPHAFFSPYALMLALIARAVDAEVVPTFLAAGVVNMIIFALGLRQFVRACASEESALAAATLALVFCVFLWGRGPWDWSGFFHFKVLATAQPYPSTFAAGLTLWALPVAMGITPERRRGLAFVAVVSALLWVTHPTTAVVLVTALAAVFVARAPRAPRAFLVEAGIWAAAAALAFAVATRWPYFPLLGLLADPSSAEFDRVSRVLYLGFFVRSWPALLIGVPAFGLAAVRSFGPRALTTGERGRDVVVWLVVFFAALYLGGFVSGRLGLGRIVSWLVLSLQIGAALVVADALRSAGEYSTTTRRAIAAAVTLVLVVIGVRSAFPAFARTIGTPRPAGDILRNIVGEDDVVLSDLNTSFMLPAVTGKIVAYPRPLFWITDHDARWHELDVFFRPGTSNDERRAIISRRDARFVLVDTTVIKNDDVQKQIRALGEVETDDGRYLLVRVGTDEPLR
jgi:hypothetical protein